MTKVSFVRAFAKVDKEGKVAIPDNVRRQAGLETGQLVEVKTAGKKRIVVSVRESAR